MSRFNELYDYVSNYTLLFKNDTNKRKNYKYRGNLFAYAIRQYILEIFNNKTINLNVSYNNSFIKGNPIEYDLLIVKELKESNLYEYDDVVCGIELKSGGYIGNIKDYKFKNKKNIKMLYISIYDQKKKIKKLKEIYDDVFIWNEPEKYTINKSYVGRKDERDFRTFIENNPIIEKKFEEWILKNIKNMK